MMNSSKNSFVLIPLFILALAAVAFAEKSKEEIKPNEVKHGDKEGVQTVHDGHDKKENQSNKPNLKVEIPPQQKSHGLPVRSPQESPSKNWKPPTSPRSGRGGNAESPIKSQRKPMTFSDIPSLPDVESTNALPSIKETEELVTDDFVGGFHHVPTMDIVVHEVNKHDAMLKSHQDQIGAIHRLATNVKNTVAKNQAKNVAGHDALRQYSQQIAKNVKETQDNMTNFHANYLNTADSHNELKKDYDKFVLADTKAKADINGKLETHRTGIDTLQKDLGTERGRITDAENAHSTLRKEHDDLSTHVKNVVGKQLSSYENHLTKNKKEMAKMMQKDQDLESEIGRIERLHNTFKDETFAGHVKGTDEKFTKAHERMDGFDKRASELSAAKEKHGQDIQGLKENVKEHGTIFENLKGKNKTRKQENLDLLKKQMELLKHQNDVHEKSQAIINHVWDYGQELPEIFVKQLDINRAYQTFLNAKEMATKMAEENQKKVLEAEKKLEEERQKMLLAKDAIEMEAVHKELLAKDELEQERVHKEMENKKKILEEKEEKMREVVKKTEAKQNEMLGEKQEIELKTVEEAKEHAENVKAAKDNLANAITAYEEALKKLADGENKKKRIEEFEKLKGEHKDTIDTKMKALKEDENKREEVKKQRKIERDARKAEAAKMTAAAARK